MLNSQYPTADTTQLQDRARLTWTTSVSYTGGSGGNSARSRTKLRNVCVATAVAAFLLGFVVGATLPAVLFSEGSSSVLLRVLPPQPSPSPSPYTTVSFVTRTTHIPDKNLLVDGVYWGDAVENMLPRGFDQTDAERWRRYAQNATVVQIKEGCGRMQNRLVTFSDGVRSCCRYRQNTDQIQGELFSFYLGQILGLRNLVPTSLGLVKSQSPKWSSVSSELILSQWQEDRPVVFTKYVENLESARIPKHFQDANRRLHPSDVLREYPGNKSREQVLDKVRELAQWSDLILFDYLTANLDRVVNNLYNLQWNSAMMQAPAHNLARNSHDQLLVFLDNESGLLHGYRLLDKYEPHHAALLDSLCVFRRPTVEVIKRLHINNNVGKLLQDSFEQHEPQIRDFLPGLPEKSVQILRERIARVYSVIDKCESLYPSGT